MSVAAQLSTATVTGVVEDSTGARIVAGRVKLINLLSGTQNLSGTGQDGAFLLPGVLPGTYSMQVERDGFAPIQFSGLTLNIGDTKNLRIRMKIGRADQTITVDASGLLIDTDDVSISTVVGGRFVSNIPLNGRSFQDLITMTPGAITQSPQAASLGSFSVNGQRTDTNTYMVDGVSANIGPGILDGNRKKPSAGQFAGTTSLGTTQGLISIDALQEFRVLGANYSAQYGHTPGGQFTLLTRSGTSQAHGSAYAYLRNSYFDAGDWFDGFNGLSRGVYFYQQDIGGTLSLPVIRSTTHPERDKTFFFASYEDLRVQQPTAPLVQYVPESSMRIGVPEPIQTLTSAFPDAEAGTTSLGLGRTYTSQVGLPSYVRTMDYRVDRSFSSKISAFLRFGDTTSGSQTRQLSSLSDTKLSSATITSGVTGQIYSGMSDELRFGYAKSRSSQSTILDGFGGSTPINLAQALGAPASQSSRAEVYIRIPGVGESSIDTDSANNSLHQWNLRNTIYKQVGSHLFTFGIDQRRFTSTVTPASLSVRADFLTLASIRNNSATDVVVTHNQPASPVFNEFSAFAQDEWRALSRLTLMLGLRWEINPPPGESHGNNAYSLQGDLQNPSSLELAPRGKPLWQTDWTALAPRLGIAWAADNREGRELVFKAGGGLIFDTANQAAVGAFNAVGFSETSESLNVPIPIAPTSFDSSDASDASPAGALAYAFPSHLRLPYTLQWNITMEKALLKHQALTLSYVGASGQRLLQPQYRDIHLQNSRVPEIVSFVPGLTSSYQSFQAKFQRSIAPGLDVLGSYVWSHTLDFGSTDPSIPLTYASSDLDVRHNVQLAFSWSQPRVTGNVFKRNAFNDWGFDGRFSLHTAYPVTPQGNLSIDFITGDPIYSGVNLVPGRPLYIYGAQFAGGRVFNGGPYSSSPALELPDAPLAGDAPRNLLRGFGAQQLTLALRRNIRLYDRLTLQLRTDVFNVSNSPDFGYVSPHLTDALFGQPTLSLNQSFGQAGSLYQQGGPRSLQWMFKVLF